MAVLRTACTLDCPDACSLEVTVEDDRVTTIDGDHRNPLTQGFICAKVRNFARHQYGEHRLRCPEIRTGPKGSGEFREATWDEALDLIASQMKQARARSGGESILPICYGGSNGMLSQDGADARLFRRLGASELLRTVCAGPTSRAYAGLYAKMPGVPLTDYGHSRLIVLWGVNPSATSIHLVPIIRRAQAEGAKLVVVDPRRTPLAKHADLHLAPRPGTDLPIALSMIDWMFRHELADTQWLANHATGVAALRERAAKWPLPEAAAEAGVDPDDLEHFARLYAETTPAVIRCGWGPERNRNGGSAVAAVLALPAVAGHFGVPGAGFTMSNSSTFALDGDAAAAAPAPKVRAINLSRVGRALCEADPAVEVAFIYNCNPLTTMPDQQRVQRGLLRDDLFTVVFDQVRTDTAAYADVLLPATTFLEHDDLAPAYGARVVNRIRPVVAPVGQARPNWMVFEALCDRLEVSEPDDPRGPQATIDAILKASPDGPAVEKSLAEDGVATPDDPSPVQFASVWPRRPSKKVELCPSDLDQEAPLGLYRFAADPRTEHYPLALISPALRQLVSSTFGQLELGTAELLLHPDDATARGITSGDEVRVFNELGEVRCRARCSDSTRAGVAVLPKGLWAHQTHTGTTSNTLVPDALTDLGAGATFNDARVQVARA